MTVVSKVLAFTLVGCLAGGTAFGIASSRRHQLVLETKAREHSMFMEIWKYGAKDYSYKEKYAMFTSLMAPVGEPVVGETFHLTVDQQFMDKSRSPLFQHLRDRYNWLGREINHIDNHLTGLVSYQGGSGKIQTQAFACFGVMFFEVRQPDGSFRRHATEPWAFVTTRSSSDLTHPVPKPHFENSDLTRADFDNPQDIEWLCGVKDFMHPEYKE